VGDENRVASELQESPDRQCCRGLAAQLRVAQPRECGNRRSNWDSGIDERLELLRQLQLVHADGADLADPRVPRCQSGRLEVDDDERRRLEQQLGARRVGEPDGIASPREPGVLADDLLEQVPREPHRRAAEREQAASGLLRVDGPPPLLDQLDEPIGGIQPQLHVRSLCEHMFEQQA
jgi:hypothetical protein